MVINHLEKLFVTSDAGTVIRELEVEHPAARMIVMATKMMEQEVRSVLSVVEEAGFLVNLCMWPMFCVASIVMRVQGTCTRNIRS